MVHVRSRFALCLALAACAPQVQPAARRPVPQIFAPNFGESDPAQDWQGARPSAHPVHGTDISVWQGRIDWPTARENGVNFVFIKATEGGDLMDPAFAANWDGAAAAGVARGAYHYFYHCSPAPAQARWFIAHVPRRADALPPVLDMEWTPQSPTCRNKRPAAEIRADARAYLALVESAYGKRPILYTTVDFFEENALWTLSDVDFWLRSTAGHPSDTYPGQPWLFWQYSGTGTVPGIRGPVDLNAFAGSRSDWANWRAE